MTTVRLPYEQEEDVLQLVTQLIQERGQFSVAPDPNEVGATRTGWVVSGVMDVKLAEDGCEPTAA